MERRRFLLTALASAFVTPLVAEAQQAGKVWRIGILSPAATSATAAPYVDALRSNLGELEWIDGHNIAFEERYSAGEPELLPQLAAELVNQKVDVILATGPTATRVAMNATKTIPIVMAPGGDAVATGLIASFARPGGNVTGLSTLTPELTVKGLEVLREATPNATCIALLFNPSFRFTTDVVIRPVQDSARSLGAVVHGVEVRTPDDFPRAFHGHPSARRRHSRDPRPVHVPSCQSDR